MTLDEGHAISYKVLPRGTPVYSADELELGKVRRVEEAAREHIFDGIVIETSQGTRFIDAPEVVRIAERAVRVSFAAAEAEAHYQPVPSRLPGGLVMRRVKQRAKRAADDAKRSWDRR